MITTIEKLGIVSVSALASSLLGDLQSIMSMKDPVSFQAGVTKAGTLESTAAIDPLASTQPWRLRIEADATEHLIINAGTVLQLPDDGTVAVLDNGVTKAGEMGSHPAVPQGTVGDKTVYFVNRSHLQTSQRQSYPLNYRITACSHGLSVFIWEPDNENAIANYSWFVIQRPVNNVTGAPLITGKCPVFAMYAIKRDATSWLSSGGDDDTLKAVDTDIIERFVVRELDVIRPAKASDAKSDTDDNSRMINAEAQVSITEDSKYVLTFPNGLNTSRFAYPNYELDMVAYSSADVISETSIADLTVYGEATARNYLANKANGARNTGMRIFQLMGGTSANL